MTPQTILILLCAAAAVLLLIRLSIGGSGRRLRSPDVGSSMTIGGREVQEDFVGTLATQTGLVAVLADGMGKAYGARIASRTAVETFLDLFRDYNAFDNPQYYFRKSFHAANRAILRELGDEGYGAASVGVAMIRENWLLRRCGKCQAMRVQKRRPGAGIRRPHPGCAGGTVVPDRQALPGGRAGHAGKPPAL